MAPVRQMTCPGLEHSGPPGLPSGGVCLFVCFNDNIPEVASLKHPEFHLLYLKIEFKIADTCPAH